MSQDKRNENPNDYLSPTIPSINTSTASPSNLMSSNKAQNMVKALGKTLEAYTSQKADENVENVLLAKQEKQDYLDSRKSGITLKLDRQKFS